MWGPMQGYGGYGMGWFGPWGGFLMVFFWIFVVVLLAGLLKWFFGGTWGRAEHARESTRKALEILEQRYARGEIERDEFLQRRDDLKR